jgi:hypothetical protein
MSCANSFDYAARCVNAELPARQRRGWTEASGSTVEATHVRRHAWAGTFSVAVGLLGEVGICVTSTLWCPIFTSLWAKI